MAPPPCMSDDGNPAVFVGTMLQTGDAVALCDACLVAWAAALLYAMTGVDPAPFIAAISDDETTVELTEAGVEATDTAVAGTDTADPPPPAKRGRTSRESPAAGTDADPDPDAPTLSVSDAPPAA